MERKTWFALYLCFVFLMMCAWESKGQEIQLRLNRKAKPKVSEVNRKPKAFLNLRRISEANIPPYRESLLSQSQTRGVSPVPCDEERHPLVPLKDSTYLKTLNEFESGEKENSIPIRINLRIIFKAPKGVDKYLV